MTWTILSKLRTKALVRWVRISFSFLCVFEPTRRSSQHEPCWSCSLSPRPPESAGRRSGACTCPQSAHTNTNAVMAHVACACSVFFIFQFDRAFLNECVRCVKCAKERGGGVGGFVLLNSLWRTLAASRSGFHPAVDERTNQVSVNRRVFSKIFSESQTGWRKPSPSAERKWFLLKTVYWRNISIIVHCAISLAYLCVAVCGYL